MRLFKRRRPPAETPWAPPAPGSCACPEHVEDLLDHEIPFGTLMDGPGGMTVGVLVECTALEVRPAVAEEQWLDLVHTGQRLGPFQWSLWLGDEGRALYDDDAPVGLNDSLLAQPGVDRVEWEDREVFLVGAPTLCESGVQAAMVRALDDPRVRLPV